MTDPAAPHVHPKWPEALSPPPRMARNRFFTGKFLSAKDLTEEQEYILDRMRLYKQALHGWGVVQGLTVKVDDGKNGCRISVSPGYAIDPSGHDILLLDPWRLELESGALRDESSGGFKVVIARTERPIEEMPALVSGRPGANQASRILEEYEIEVIPNDARPHAQGVPLAHLHPRPDGSIHATMTPSARRRIGLDRSGPVITAINWRHSRERALSEGLALEIHFDRSVTGDVGPETFELMQHKGGVLSRIHTSPHLSSDGLTAHLDIGRSGDDLASLIGQTLRVRLHCDFITDAYGVPVSGRHVAGRLPTGAGGPGGVFESWFTLKADPANAGAEKKGVHPTHPHHGS